MIGLVDSDIICYRVGYTTNDDSESAALDTVDSFLTDLITCESLLDVMEFKYFLTGKTNFRYDYAVTKEYKGNRSGREKPQHLQAIRNHLIDTWGATVSEGQEADDDMSIAQYQYGDDSIIISLDKDLDMVPGWHYNFVKFDKYYITKEEGLHRFYTQILTGDQVDNIKGATRVGKVKAAKLLEECKTELEMWQACVEAHDSFDRALEDARLLWMRSKPDEIWEPPSDS